MNYLTSPTQILIGRGKDPTGHGYYGAKRSWKKDGKHHGFDIVTIPGEPIFSCNKGRIRVGNVYSKNKPGKPTMKLVETTDSEHKVKLLYVKPIVKTGQKVEKGEIIGYAQDITDYHTDGEFDPDNNMLNHIHAQVWKNGLETDPEAIIKEF